MSLFFLFFLKSICFFCFTSWLSSRHRNHGRSWLNAQPSASWFCSSSKILKHELCRGSFSCFICSRFIFKDIEGSSKRVCLIKKKKTTLGRAGLYEDRDTVVGFPSQKCQCALWPPGLCTRDFALFQTSSPYGALLSCLRMRWKVSLWIVASSCYCDVKSCQHLNATSTRRAFFFLIHTSERKLNCFVKGFSRTDNSALCFWFKCPTKSGILWDFAYCCFGVWAKRLKNNSPLDINSTLSSNNYCSEFVYGPHDFPPKTVHNSSSPCTAHCHWE